MLSNGDWHAVEGILSKDMAIIAKYLDTWKMKLSAAEALSAVFQLNNKEAKHELKVNFNNEQRNPVLLHRTQIPQSNVGYAHVSPTPQVTSQKAGITRHTFEAAFWLGMGCWDNNAANSHLAPGPFNSTALLVAAVLLKPASLILSSTTPCEL